MADQLGPHFDDGGEILLIEAKAVLARRPYHWAKAQLILSALRHRRVELGDRASYVAADHYRDVLSPLLSDGEHIDMVNPTTWGSRALAMVAAKSAEDFFQNWAKDKKPGLKLENYYRRTPRNL
jgi:deoxyribodipyrimidine photolyase-related protein